jgi:hypothetical protein
MIATAMHEKPLAARPTHLNVLRVRRKTISFHLDNRHSIPRRQLFSIRKSLIGGNLM